MLFYARNESSAPSSNEQQRNVQCAAHLCVTVDLFQCNVQENGRERIFHDEAWQSGSTFILVCRAICMTVIRRLRSSRNVLEFFCHRLKTFTNPRSARSRRKRSEAYLEGREHGDQQESNDGENEINNLFGIG